MIIHVVEQGETMESIAKKYEVPPDRLIRDNGFRNNYDLVIGQTVVIAYPQKTYTVQEGDTLQQIAEDNNITIIQLLRNNPDLSDRKYIYPGETLVISYNNTQGKITSNGYASPYILEETLRRTLPYLSYLSIFGHRSTNDANIIDIEDTSLINITKDYRVVPIMMVSSRTELGGVHPEIINLLYNDLLVDKHIENIIILLQRKGYYGVNLSIQLITEDNRPVYEGFIGKLSERLRREGYLLFITVSENFYVDADKIIFDKIDFNTINKYVDGVTILNYNWGYSYGPPAPVASVYLMKQYFDYITKMIPPDKIEIGLPIIGYDWELPYIIGVSKANALTLESVITLARDTGTVIQFDEVSQTPYFNYTDKRSGAPRSHIVWFVDARSIEAILKMVIEFGFRGTGIWNIMNYYAQMWLIMNSDYEIDTLLS